MNKNKVSVSTEGLQLLQSGQEIVSLNDLDDPFSVGERVRLTSNSMLPLYARVVETDGWNMKLQCAKSSPQQHHIVKHHP